jgi:hypothetical protein
MAGSVTRRDMPLTYYLRRQKQNLVLSGKYFFRSALTR